MGGYAGDLGGDFGGGFGDLGNYDIGNYAVDFPQIDYLSGVGDMFSPAYYNNYSMGLPTLQSDNPGLLDTTIPTPQPQGPGLFSQIANTGMQGLGLGTGLAGIIQQMTMGRPRQQTTTQPTQQTVRSTVTASPQQEQLTQQTLAALANLQNQAQNAQLNQAISSLLQGNLPITPNLVDQVTKAFGGSMSGLMKSTAENARQRGWQGTEGDVAMGAGSPVLSQGINDIQNQVNQALVNLALGIPQAAANMQGQLVNQQMAPITGMENLLGQLQNFAGLQGGRTVNSSGGQTDLLGPRQNNFLQALPAISQLSLGLGQGMANRTMMQQPYQSGPSLSGV